MSTYAYNTPRSITWSPQPTVGLEQELHTVRADTMELVGGAAALIACARPISERHGFPALQYEYMANTVELTAGPALRIPDLIDSYWDQLVAISDVADGLHLCLSPLGLHPFADFHAQKTTRMDRYHAMVEREQLLGREQQNIGVHFHVGVPSGEAAVAAMNTLAIYLPVFAALSASSPFWQGEDSGYEAFRPFINEPIPPSGVPPHFTNYEEFCALFETLEAAGFVRGLNDIWWDIRPSRYGTVELRICDGIATVGETAALAALAQCLVVYSQRPGVSLPEMGHDLLRLNRFQALRYGVDAEVSLDGGPRQRLATQIEQLVDKLTPTAQSLGCATELANIPTMLAVGSSSRRQRLVYDATGSLPSVARAGVQELRDGVMLPQQVTVLTPRPQKTWWRYIDSTPQRPTWQLQ